MNKINKIIIVIAVAFLGLALIAYIFLNIEKKSVINKSKEINTDVSKAESKNESIEHSLDDIFVQTENDEKWVNVISGKNTIASAIEGGNFSGFDGMLKPDESKNETVDDNVLVTSLDKNKFIVRHIIRSYVLQQINDNIQDDVISSDDYLCSVSDLKCEKTDVISTNYQGLENLQQDSSAISWKFWDSQKNLLYGNLNYDNGDVSPVYICDTLQKKCNKTDGYNSLNTAEIRANLPEGFFSKSLDNFVMIVQNDLPDEQTGSKWEMLLYASNDLTKPQKNFDISAAIDRNQEASYDSVYSLAWSSDEKKIAVATVNRIYLLDLESGKLELLYMAPIDSESLYLDNNAITFASDDRYVVFVQNFDSAIDLSQTDSDLAKNSDNENNAIGMLKKIDLANKNEVSDISEEKGLQIQVR